MRKLALVLALSLWANVGLSYVNKWNFVGEFGVKSAIAGTFIVMGAWFSPLGHIRHDMRKIAHYTELENTKLDQIADSNDKIGLAITRSQLNEVLNDVLSSLDLSPKEQRMAERKLKEFLAQLHKDE